MAGEGAPQQYIQHKGGGPVLPISRQNTKLGQAGQITQVFHNQDKKRKKEQNIEWEDENHMREAAEDQESKYRFAPQGSNRKKRVLPQWMMTRGGKRKKEQRKSQHKRVKMKIERGKPEKEEKEIQEKKKIQKIRRRKKTEKIKKEKRRNRKEENKRKRKNKTRK